MSIVSLSAMLVRREPTSILPIKKSESCSVISSAKSNDSFTAYLLLVKDFQIGTSDFVNLQVGVLVVNKIDQMTHDNRQYLCKLYKVHKLYLAYSQLVLETFLFPQIYYRMQQALLKLVNLFLYYSLKRHLEGSRFYLRNLFCQ